MSKKPRIHIPSAVRKYVLERDRYRCQSCGQTNREITLEVDHVISLAQGGSNDMSNLQTLCRDCNQRKKHYFDSRFQRCFDL